MGLWEKIFGQFIDVIEWLGNSHNTLVYRFERYDYEIKYGAKLAPNHQPSGTLEPDNPDSLRCAVCLNGFDSEIYQVDLDSGFEQARLMVDQAIRADVRRHIGGDQQQIQQLPTHHRHHCLFFITT